MIGPFYGAFFMSTDIKKRTQYVFSIELNHELRLID